MPENFKITSAFCLEWEKNVSINEVYNQFVCGNVTQRLNFSCVDPRCQKKGVIVIGVGYDKLPSQRKVSIHFRTHPSPDKNQHDPDCLVLKNNQYEKFSGIHEDETELQSALRKARYQKINDLIDIYDPTEHSKQEGIILDKEESDFEHPAITKPANQDKLSDIAKNLNRTSSFSRFVRYYHEMATNFNNQELAQFELQIVGLGKTSLFDYFKFFAYAFYDPSFTGIHHGLIKSSIKKYNEGFRIFFRARIKNIPVRLYVSNDQVKAYRHKNELLDVLKNSESLGNITAYFIPSKFELKQHNGNQYYELIIDDLSKLLFLGDVENNRPSSLPNGVQ